MNVRFVCVTISALCRSFLCHAAHMTCCARLKARFGSADVLLLTTRSCLVERVTKGLLSCLEDTQSSAERVGVFARCSNVCMD